MSTEGGGGNKPKSWPETKVTKQESSKGTTSTPSQVVEPIDQSGTPTTDPERTHITQETSAAETKPSALETEGANIPTTQTSSTQIQGQNEESPRQVIAVSASKGPAAFFNLARKFLVTDETCDLSALEGAIVSAVDAAHLLERSKLATIIRIQTSYVAVGPKRKKNTATSGADIQAQTMGLPPGSQSVKATASNQGATSVARMPPTQSVSTTMAMSSDIPQSHARLGKSKDSVSGGKELRRARMIITVKRTEDYKKWLNENPLQDPITGDDDVVESTSESRSHPAK